MAQSAPGKPAAGGRRGQADRPVAVYNRWCKGCGICVEFCPRKVLELSAEAKAVAVHIDKCTRCRLCEVLCPDFAITVSPKSEPGTAGTADVIREGEPVAKGRGS